MTVRCPRCLSDKGINPNNILIDNQLIGCNVCGNYFTIPAQSVPAQGLSKEELSELSTPTHYRVAIQPVDYIAANNMDFFHGNVIKYVTRWQGKDGIKDLEKAMDYLQRIIKLTKEGHYGEQHK